MERNVSNNVPDHQYKIIESHQGRIDVRSEQGLGSTFIVSLPTHIARGLKLHALAR